MRTRNPGSQPVWERNMNEEQLAVIRHGEGPLQTLAQAGSGKTRALVHRVARLVEEGVPAERILLVTFSRKAADEMDARVRQLGVGGVSCQTWHALCARILREDQTSWGRWTVDDTDRAKTFVKKAIGHEHLNWKGADLTKVRRFIGQCKANLFAPDSEGAIKLAGEIFRLSGVRACMAYRISQELIEAAALLTFDDMIVFAHRHLLDEERRQEWAGRFDYVMTDEAQDNNAAQVALQEMLCRDHRNLMVVGDLAQAIYSFRGSSPQYLADFEGQWSASRIAMCRNYRSGREIVRVANEVIRPAERYRQPEDMIGMRDSDGLVRVVPCDTLEDEGREFCEMVRAEVESGRKLGDICVLYRLNAQSRALEEAMLKARLPYQIVGGINFYERKEVKDLLGYLRVAAGRDRDGDAVKRCINAPFRFLGARFLDKVKQVADEVRQHDPSGGPLPWSEIVEQAAGAAGIQSRQRDSVEEWCRLIGELRIGIEADETTPQDARTAFQLLDGLVKRTQYIEWLEREEGEESIESSHAATVRELLRVSQQFATVGELLDYVDRNVQESAKQKRTGKGKDQLTLMSIHRSKGLEWPIVWLVGCNDQILPHAKGDLEEERRLMYVACTRARDQLHVSWVREMATRQGIRQLDSSPFLDRFPGQGVDKVDGECVTVFPAQYLADLERQRDAKVREICRTPAEVERSTIELEIVFESCQMHGPYVGECGPCAERRRAVFGI